MAKRASGENAGVAEVGELPPHPAVKQTQWLLFFVVGGGALSLAWAVATTGVDLRESLPTLLIALACGGAILFAGVYTLLIAPAVQRVNLALGAIERGELARAEALLDGISRWAPVQPRRAALIQRALLALQRGDVEAMRAPLDAAKALPMPLFDRTSAQLSKGSIRALDALALALAGDRAGALAEAQAVWADDEAPCDALAIASVADALCQWRSGEGDALAARLRRDHDLVAEHAPARLRQLARALGRAANQAAGKTPYREPADEVASSPSALGAWAERLVPGMGAFVEDTTFAQAALSAREGPNASAPDGEAAESDARAPRETRGQLKRAGEGEPKAPAGMMSRVVRGLVFFALACVALPFLLPSPPPAEGQANLRDVMLSTLIPMLPGVVFMMAGVLWWSRSRRRDTAPPRAPARVHASKAPKRAAPKPWWVWGTLALAFVGLWQFVGSSPPPQGSRGRVRDARALKPSLPTDDGRRDREFAESEESEEIDEFEAEAPSPLERPAARTTLAPKAARTEFEGRRGPSKPSAPPIDWFTLIVPLVGVGSFMAFLRRRTRVEVRALLKARRALALGENVAEARASLEALTQSRRTLNAGAMWLELARFSAREGDFEQARRHCEVGLGTFTQNHVRRVASHDYLLPELRALFAYSLAACDDGPRAEAELEALRTEHPAFPGFASAAQKVRLLVAVRRGDVGRAAYLAASRPLDLSMPWRDELLGELSIVVNDPAGVGRPSVERLSSELRADPPLLRWLDRSAPALMNAFRRIDAGRSAQA